MLPAKKCKNPIFCKQKPTSQKPKLILQIFFDKSKEEAFMYNVHHVRCIFILSGFFGGEIETRYTLCVRYTVCNGGPYLGAKLWLAF